MFVIRKLEIKKCMCAIFNTLSFSIYSSKSVQLFYYMLHPIKYSGPLTFHMFNLRKLWARPASEPSNENIAIVILICMLYSLKP